MESHWLLSPAQCRADPESVSRNRQAGEAKAAGPSHLLLRPHVTEGLELHLQGLNTLAQSNLQALACTAHKGAPPRQWGPLPQCAVQIHHLFLELTDPFLCRPQLVTHAGR